MWSIGALLYTVIVGECGFYAVSYIGALLYTVIVGECGFYAVSYIGALLYMCSHSGGVWLLRCKLYWCPVVHVQS